MVLMVELVVFFLFWRCLIIGWNEKLVIYFRVVVV